MGDTGLGSQYMGEEYPGLKKPDEHNPEGTKKSKEPVNLNTASLKQIGDLPLIGDYRAKDIIEKRPFKSWDDVAKIPGITKDMIDAMKDGRATIE